MNMQHMDREFRSMFFILVAYPSDNHDARNQIRMVNRHSIGHHAPVGKTHAVDAIFIQIKNLILLLQPPVLGRRDQSQAY